MRGSKVIYTLNLKSSMRKAKRRKKKTHLDKYSGQWVAFLGDRVVENGRTLNSLMKKMEEKGIEKKAAIFCVPKKGQVHF